MCFSGHEGNIVTSQGSNSLLEEAPPLFLLHRPPGGGFGLRDGSQLVRTATQREQEGLMGRLLRLGTAHYLYPLHILPFAPPHPPAPPLLPCCHPKGTSRAAEENRSQQLHLVITRRTPAASAGPLRLRPPLMGTSHSRRLARGVHLRCHAAPQLFLFFSVCLK